MLVRYNRVTVLIDTGNDASILRALGTALPFGTRHIDVLVLTDTGAAQIGGLPFIRERYTIGAIAHPGDRVTIDGVELPIK